MCYGQTILYGFWIRSAGGIGFTMTCARFLLLLRASHFYKIRKTCTNPQRRRDGRGFRKQILSSWCHRACSFFGFTYIFRNDWGLTVILAFSRRGQIFKII